jgi:hypothetical protein
MQPPIPNSHGVPILGQPAPNHPRLAVRVRAVLEATVLVDDRPVQDQEPSGSTEFTMMVGLPFPGRDTSPNDLGHIIETQAALLPFLLARNIMLGTDIVPDGAMHLFQQVVFGLYNYVNSTLPDLLIVDQVPPTPEAPQ